MAKNNRNNWAYALVTLLVIFIGIGVFFHQPIKNQLNSWKLLPQPERLTELYFNNSSKLPTTYIPGVPQSFSFTIHNLEYKNMKYNYTVDAIANNVSKTLSSGSVNLSQNQYKIIPENIVIPDLGPRVEISVALANPNQTIDYLVNRSEL